MTLQYLTPFTAYKKPIMALKHLLEMTRNFQTHLYMGNHERTLPTWVQMDHSQGSCDTLEYKKKEVSLVHPIYFLGICGPVTYSENIVGRNRNTCEYDR